jgi:hypothetical protein
MLQFVVVVALMGVLPIVSILVEHLLFSGGADLVALIGKWFVFWGVGCRLLITGIRQIADPTYTAETIFRIGDPSAQKIVAELGFGNVAIGTLAVLTIFKAAWVMPAAIAGFLFYALAGAKHVFNRDRTPPENVAMVSDIFIAVVLAAYLAMAWGESA